MCRIGEVIFQEALFTSFTSLLCRGTVRLGLSFMRGYEATPPSRALHVHKQFFVTLNTDNARSNKRFDGVRECALSQNSDFGT
jgi:hypothetical protein